MPWPWLLGSRGGGWLVVPVVVLTATLLHSRISTQVAGLQCSKQLGEQGTNKCAVHASLQSWQRYTHTLL